ncbi:MAG: radical SAM protein [Deltaproteobacteria bacterium]|nr:radical SAM protein [Deltaproteobacteria bacterium]
MAKKQLIIPAFLPFGGCAHQCVFCDQAGITGERALPPFESIAPLIEKYLSTWKGAGLRELAFYGGSFTGLPRAVQEGYLKASKPYVESGRIDSVRISTRPDNIDPETLRFVKTYGVKTIELGVQSMSDEVLKASGRGHTAEDTRRAASLIKEAGIRLGVQLMPGLPRDTTETILDTVDKAVSLSPDFARLYPALVLRNTPLFRMYERGEYRPWALDDMVLVCKEAMKRLASAGVPVIRVGLQTTEELSRSLVAGPYHPSFRELLLDTGRAL